MDVRRDDVVVGIAFDRLIVQVSIRSVHHIDADYSQGFEPVAPIGQISLTVLINPDCDRIRPLAPSGHGSMSDLSPLSGEERSAPGRPARSRWCKSITMKE